MYKIYQGDALALFKQITDKSIDCIITDPPYEVISGARKKISMSIGPLVFYLKMMVKFLSIIILTFPVGFQSATEY